LNLGCPTILTNTVGASPFGRRWILRVVIDIVTKIVIIAIVHEFRMKIFVVTGELV